MNKKLILIVEDEEIERNLLGEVLITLGYDSVEAENGKIALDVLKEKNVDLVLSDIHMPEMNGLELLRQVRSNGNKDLPVVLMTGFDPHEAQSNSVKYRAAALLIKPFRLIQLKEVLDKLLL